MNINPFSEHQLNLLFDNYYTLTIQKNFKIMFKYTYNLLVVYSNV